MKSEDIFNLVQSIHFLITVILIPLVIWLFTMYKKITFTLKKDALLFTNLNRKIKIFYPSSDKTSLKIEFDEIKKTKIFNPEIPTSDLRDKNNIDSNSLVIIGYRNDNQNDFFDIWNVAVSKKAPIIVYTYGDNNALDPITKNRLSSEYQWYSIANVPMTLINNVFSILATFPYDRK